MSGDLKNVMSINKPAVISSEYSFIEVISFDLFATVFLDRAAKIQNNNLKRMQNVVAYMISSQHYTATKIFNRVPLDPVTGET